MKLEKSEKVLLAAALFMCAFIVGYNAFFVPKAEVATVIKTSESSFNENLESTNNQDDDTDTQSQSKNNTDSLSADSKDTIPSNKDKSGYKNSLININTASESELSDNLKGVGNVVAKRIVDYRNKNGGFSSIDEIKNVKGIGEKIFAKIKNNITVK